MTTCPLCDRELGNVFDDHHLVPKSKKGRETVTLHKICHNNLHSVLTETEMECYYHTIERLLSHPEVAKFVHWVKKKPIDFYVKTKDSNDRKRKRRR